ncbi:hypothetical protein GCM10027591_12410 [Zhihengliuella somnathii]
MNDEIELITDPNGIAVIGSATAVERFLESEELPSTDLGLPRLDGYLRAGSEAARVGAALTESSGRWVKLTKESAQAYKKFEAMKGPTTDVSRAILMDKGKTKHVLQFVKKPGAVVGSPAMLTGIAGIMTQMAMQQSMDEISDYLAVIDAKVDEILRAQKDAVFADMIGVDFVVEEAMTIRDSTGKVSETTWSKVQSASMVIGRTQGYALRQLDALASKLEKASKMGDIADAAKAAEAKARDWLAVLARCFQLQDACAVLELDRVLDAEPLELDRHRVGVQAARQKRQETIAVTTERLLARMESASSTANTKVLLNPTSARTVISSSNSVATSVVSFHELLGLDHGWESLEAKRWLEAVGDARDKVVEVSAESAGAVRQKGTETFERARAATGRFSSGVAERARRLGQKGEGPADEV